MAHLAARGVSVHVVTVFGGDPSADRDPGGNNRRAGFTTTGEAARRRRSEDDEACALLGLHTWRLCFDDDEASPRDGKAISKALAPILRSADIVLVPGSPLSHPDHLLASKAAASAAAEVASPAGLYLEQPYAAWIFLNRTLRWPSTAPPHAPAVVSFTQEQIPWQRMGGCPRCQARKWTAVGAYRSQLRVLRRWPRARVLSYETLSRGERVAWPQREKRLA
jgi:LmbE family N-acetylglucosaminyl deacetylase